MENDKEYENTCVNIIKRDFGSLSSGTSSSFLPFLRNPSTSTPLSSSIGVGSQLASGTSGLSSRGRTSSIRVDIGKGLDSPKKDSGRLELDRKAELLDLRATVKRLESKCSSLESQYKTDKAKWKNAEESNQHIIQWEKQKLESLQRKNDSLTAELEKLRQDLSASKRDARAGQEEVSAAKLQLLEQKRLVEEELEQYKISIHDAVVGLRTQLNHAHEENSELRSKVTESQERIAALEKQNGDLMEYCQSKLKVEEELRNAQNENLELRMQVSRLDDQLKLTNAYTEEIAMLPKMKEELARLEQQNRTFLHGLRDKHIMEEKIIGLEAALEASKERIKIIPGLYETIERLQKYVQQWQQTVGEALNREGEVRVDDFLSFVDRCRKAELEYVSKITKLKERIGELESETRLLQHKIQTIESQPTKAKTSEEEVRKLNKKLNLVTKERDMYKNVLDGYEQDMTVRLDSNLAQRVAQLEEILAEYRSTQGDKISIPQPSVSEEEMNQLKQKISELEEKLKEKTKDEGIKILRPKYSLVDIARRERAEKIASIEEENESLKARIKLMEEGQNEDLTQMVGHRVKAVTTKEVEALKAQLESANRVQERLKETFRTTSSNFREAVKQVFGFKIDSIPPKYYMRSIYSESANDRLLFMMDDNGDIQFIETEFSQKLGHLVEEHLQNNRSLPMFMSALTAELFASQGIFDDVSMVN